MASLILGHNQFIGVDHLSQERGREREQKFSEKTKVLDLLRAAVDAKVNGLMFSTHPRLREVLSFLRDDRELRTKLDLFPILPYVQGYVRRANEIGMVKAGMEAVRGTTNTKKFRIATRTARGFLAGNPYPILRSLVETELLPFRHLRIQSVILHNVVTDLLLGWRATTPFSYFDRVVRDKLSVRPAYATFNYPLLVKHLLGSGIRKPQILTSVNGLGFQMNPSRAACEDELNRRRSDVIAMSIFAAGRLKPQEAIDYVSGFPLESIVFGASTREHIADTAGRIAASLPALRAGAS